MTIGRRGHVRVGEAGFKRTGEEMEDVGAWSRSSAEFWPGTQCCPLAEANPRDETFLPLATRETRKGQGMYKWVFAFLWATIQSTQPVLGGCLGEFPGISLPPSTHPIPSS